MNNAPVCYSKLKEQKYFFNAKGRFYAYDKLL